MALGPHEGFPGPGRRAMVSHPTAASWSIFLQGRQKSQEHLGAPRRAERKRGPPEEQCVGSLDWRPRPPRTLEATVKVSGWSLEADGNVWTHNPCSMPRHCRIPAPNSTPGEKLTGGTNKRTPQRDAIILQITTTAASCV